MIHELAGLIHAARQMGDVDPTHIFICGETEEQTAKLHAAFERAILKWSVNQMPTQNPGHRFKNFKIENTMIEFRTKSSKPALLIR